MRRYPILSAFLFAAMLPACGDDPRLPAHEFEGSAMGTSFHITIVDPAADLDFETLHSRLIARLNAIENVASTYRDRSDLAKFNLDESTGWIGVSGELCAMIASAAAIGDESGGAFDITIGPLVDLWGFGPADGSGNPPQDVDIKSAQASVGLDKLDIDCSRSQLLKSAASTRVDLSGWAKGYAVDELAEVLDSAGQLNYLVEIGGELRVKGHNATGGPFSIAIENPATASAGNLTVISLSDSGIATSGDYRNFFEHEGIRYSHTLDPRTGRPVTHALSAVTVIHPSTAYADGMATALLVLGPQAGLDFANTNGLAAYFAVSTPAGLKYLSSNAFDAGQYLAR